MGTIRELIKIDKGETYDLGKILGSFLPTIEPFTLPSLYKDKESFRKDIEKDLEYGWSFDNDKDRTLYIHWLCDNIWDWCKHDRLMCSVNCSYAEDIDYYSEKFECLIKDYSLFKETGTRYK